MSTPKVGNIHIIKAAILVALICLMYYQTIIWFFIRWGRSSSYYSHGYLVAPIALFLVWRKRAKIRAAVEEQRCGGVEGQGRLYSSAPTRLHPLGLVVMCCGLLIHIISTFWRVSFTSGFSIIPVLIGLVLYVYGASVTRHVLLPILFLAFMVPFPLVAVARISLKMKLFATECVTTILQLLGVVAVQDGSRIHFAKDSILVGDVCSGLRSLIALLAFGALFAHLTPTSRVKKMILLLASVPAALIANIVRILIMGLITNWWGVEYTQGITHDATGLLIFIVAFILLFGLERILDRPRGSASL